MKLLLLPEYYSTGMNITNEIVVLVVLTTCLSVLKTFQKCKEKTFPFSVHFCSVNILY